MAKFNGATVQVAKGKGVIENTDVQVLTHQSGLGFKRSAKSELFLAGVSTFVEDTFYERADVRMSRIRTLVSKVVLEDQGWIRDFVFWLRHTAQMRSVSLAIALDAAKVLNDNKVAGGRQIVSAAMDRADEPGEAIAYWHSNYGRKLPQSVKRGIADAASKLYNERSIFKYDADGKAVRFADVIQLTHPLPATAKQSSVFKFALDRRYNAKAEAPAELTVAKAREAVKGLSGAELRKLADNGDLTAHLKASGMTWESLSSVIDGGMDAKAWEAVIPTMGYMALLRNLRNFLQAGVDRRVLNSVAKRISAEEEVAKSRQLPFRFWSAYNAVGSNNVFKLAIDDALNASAKNVPALKGKTLVLVDVSGSMFWHNSTKSDIASIDSATLFAGVLASRANDADVVWFGSRSGMVGFSKTDSPLEIMKKISREGGGTNLEGAIRQWYKAGYDRVIVITDEQHNGGRVFSPIPTNVPVFVWNLGGYSAAASNQSNVFTQGGLSDASFGYISLVEAGTNEAWPWA